MSDSTSTTGDNGGQPSYKIGAVSRLTHIPAPTLRMWERRYTVVVAKRTAKQARLYSKADVTRLALIKQLVDLGNAISTMANLSFEQLLEVKASYDGSNRELQSISAQTRVIVVGEELHDRLRRAPTAAKMLSVVAQMRSLESLNAQALNLQADVAILDIENIDERAIDRVVNLVDSLGARNAVVIFNHATERALEQTSPSLSLIRRPVSVATLIRLCLAPAFDLSTGKTEWLGVNVEDTKYQRRESMAPGAPNR